MQLADGHQGFYGYANMEDEPAFYLFGSRTRSGRISAWVTKVTLNQPIRSYADVQKPIGIGERTLVILALLVSLKDKAGNPADMSTQNLHSHARLDLDKDDKQIAKHHTNIMNLLEILGLAKSRMNRGNTKREVSRWR